MTIQEIKKEREMLEKKLKELIEKEKAEKTKAIRSEVEEFINSLKEKGFDKLDMEVNGFRIRVYKPRTGGGRKGKVLVDGIEYHSFSAACKELGYEVNGDSARRVLERHGHEVDKVAE